MKLYLVKCVGMQTSFGNHTTHGIAYVVADDAEEAYQLLRQKLDKNDIGFSRERVLDTVQLIAEEGDYPECNVYLIKKASDK